MGIEQTIGKIIYASYAIIVLSCLQGNGGQYAIENHGIKKILSLPQTLSISD
jgi:hypothetical protein